MESYFGKPNIESYMFSQPVQKSHFLTSLRKRGDEHGQYIASIRYLDTLEWSYDNTEIYCEDDEDDTPVYSSYHSDCDYCQEFLKKVRDNAIVGFRVYPKGVIAPQYEERKKKWEQFTCLNE